MTVARRLVFARFVLVFLAAVAGSGAPISDAAPPADPPGNPPLRVSKDEHHPNELLVKFRPGAPAHDAEAAVRGEGAQEVMSFKRPRKLASSPIDRWRLAKFAPGVDLEQARVRLLRNPHVDLVEYNYKVSIDLTPNDPMYPQLWGLNNTGQTGGKIDADIDAPETWDIQTGSQEVLVAVVDTGVDYNHPDLSANIWTNPGEIPGNGIDDDGNGYVDDVHGYNFYADNGDPRDDHGHGTHVSGTIAAVGNNGVGVAGVAWQARIMAVKFLGPDGSGTESAAIQAVLYAADMNARVMNNSWGGGVSSQALKDAIATADMAGALFVAAAGNSSSNNDSIPTYPASYAVPNVIAVAATDSNDAKAGFSNYGALSVHLGAPGVNILSTVPTTGSVCCSDPSGYKQLSGTSMAAPHVSGAAALVFAQFPGITHHQVKDRLLMSVEPVLPGITITGGRLHLVDAFENDTTPPAAVTDLGVVDRSARSVSLVWGATGDDGMTGSATSYELRYSRAPIDESNFDAAARENTIPATGPAGTIEFHTVAGLNPETHYYFALKVRDNVGNLSPISNLADATTLAIKIVFNDDFESGAANWTIAGSDGVGGPALWHLSTHRSASPTTAFYYGKESTLTYDTGARNFGSITSNPISLKGVAKNELTFAYLLETESNSTFDIARIQVTEDDGATWNNIATAFSSPMTRPSVNLSAYDGKLIRLRFSFDTMDDGRNGFEGWVVDDVRVQGEQLPPAPPVANPGGPYSGGLGKLIQFDGSGSSDPNGDPLTYAWNFGDGATGTGVKPTHVYAALGVYTVTLVVNDGGFNSTPATTTVTIANLQPTANPGGPYTAQKNIPVTLDGSGSSDGDGDPLTYAWDFGDGTSGSGPTPTHVYTVSGTYTVKLTVNDGKVNSAAATTTVAASNTAPIAKPGGPYAALNKIAVTLDGSGSTDANGDPLTYAWDFGDGTSGSGPTPTHAYTAIGTYTVKLTVNDGEASSAVATTTVTVTNQPPVANPGGPYSGQRNKPIVFDGTRSSDPNNDPLTYSWNFGDGSIGFGSTPSHAYAKSGTYTVSLVVSDGTYNSASVTTTATVTNTVPVARLTGPFTIFKQQSVAFDGSASSDADGDALTFNWTFGDGQVFLNGGPNPIHRYLGAGVFTASLTVNDGEADSAPAATTVTVVNRPPIANAGPDQTVTQRSTVIFSGANSSDPDGFIVSYAWRQVSGTAVTLSNTSGVTTQFVAPTVKGGTSLQLVFELAVTDDDGATGTDQVVVTVVK